MAVTDKTNEQVVAALALEGDQSKKLLKLLDRSGLNISEFDTVDGFFEAIRAEGQDGTLGKGGGRSQNRVNSIIRLLGAGGINAPGGVGGQPIFQNPQLSSIRVALGDENVNLPSVPDQAADIQRFMEQQRGMFLGQLPGQPQLQLPGVTGATGAAPPNITTQGLLSRGTPGGAAALRKLGLLG